MPTKTGYTRQSSATLVDGQVATAAKFNNEYDLLETAFDATNGHVHDGTAANGGPIPQIMSTDAKDKVVVNGVSHYVGTWVNVAGTTTEQVRTEDGAVYGVTDNDIDLGKSSNAFKNLYLKGTLTNAGGTLTLPSATDTLVGRATTDTLTNKTLTSPVINGTVTGTGVIAQGKHTIWIPAAALRPRTTNGCASIATVELTSTRPNINSCDFDASTEEFAQFGIAMPKSWDEGTVTAQFVWSHASTTTNFGVVWALRGVAVSDDDATDAAFGTEQTATDTGGTTNDTYISPETSAITLAGSPAEGDVAYFEVSRKVANASDTMAIDARLHGIKLYYTVAAGTDA